jgi:hypothetical protein
MQKNKKAKKQKSKKAKKQKSKKAKKKKRKKEKKAKKHKEKRKKEKKKKKKKSKKSLWLHDYMNEVYLWESSKSRVGKLKYPNAETDSGLYAIPNNGVYPSVLAFGS